MATYYLCNSLRFGAIFMWAGSYLDSSVDDTTGIAAAGGLLVPSSTTGMATASANALAIKARGGLPEEATAIMNAAYDSHQETTEATLVTDLASTSAGKGLSLIGMQDSAGRFTAAQGEAALAEVGGRILGAFATEAAIKAIAAAARTNGQIVVDLTNDAIWIFDSASAAGASNWVLVPDAGTGRWLRNHVTLADLAAVTAAGLIGSDAAGYIAATVAAQLTEVKVIADAGMPVSKRTVAVGHADLTDAVNGEAQAINLGAVLPANARIVGACVKLTTPFTGGGAVSVALDIGTAGDPNAIVAGADVLAAAVDGQSSTLPSGIAPNKHFVAAGAQLLATFTPDGAHNLNDLTAGAADIDVLYVILA